MTTSSGPLDQTKFAKYDELMQACLKTGAHCILDIHSYARFRGTSTGPTVGQGGPSIDDLANLWTTLAKFYAADANVIMGFMNEPNGVDISIWSQAVQAAVNAIRGAGAEKQMILLPGKYLSLSPIRCSPYNHLDPQPPYNKTQKNKSKS